VTRAAVDGVKSNDVIELGQRYNVPFEWPEDSVQVERLSSSPWKSVSGYSVWPHPRTPGAELLMVPLLLVPGRSAYLAATIANALFFLLLVVVIIPRVEAVNRERLLLVAPLALAAAPVFGTFEYGTKSMVLAVLLGAAWISGRHRDSILAGAAIAIAITLKLWPAFILLPFLYFGRRRVVSVAVGGAVALNVVGMVAFQTSPVDLVSMLARSGETFLLLVSNSSAVAWLAALGWSPVAVFSALAVVGGLGTWWTSRCGGYDAGVAFATTTALLISPLSWAHYDMVLIGVALWLMSRRGPGRLLGIGWLLMALTGLSARWLIASIPLQSLWTLGGRLVLLTGISWWVIAQPSRRGAKAFAKLEVSSSP